jgi:hypothetical protein
MLSGYHSYGIPLTLCTTGMQREKCRGNYRSYTKSLEPQSLRADSILFLYRKNEAENLLSVERKPFKYKTMDKAGNIWNFKSILNK